MAIDYPSLDNPTAGAFRFNTDSDQMEIYDGNQWTVVLSTSPYQQTGGDRGLFGGGLNAPNNAQSDVIDYINASSTGNFTDFGNLTYGRQGIAAGASRTRAVWSSGGFPYSNVIDYITITSTGNASDFGDSTQNRRWGAGFSDATRGIFAGGYSPTPANQTRYNIIDYVTIASTGNANDFGDMNATTQDAAGCSSPTRGIIAGGRTPTTVDTIEYVTISTTGNVADFGNLTAATYFADGASNAVRGVIGGGYRSPAYTKEMNYVTIASQGDAVDFGDLVDKQENGGGGLGTNTRGIFSYGDAPGSYGDHWCFVQIMTTGNAVKGGDLAQSRFGQRGTSNAHGGL